MFTLADVEVMVEVKIDDTPVRGNAVASGDEVFNKQVENEILARLERGDAWAWASVKVMVTPKSGRHVLTGCSYLGGCNYRDQQDFLVNSGYYEDMVTEALQDLNTQAETLFNVLLAQKEKAVA